MRRGRVLLAMLALLGAPAHGAERAGGQPYELVRSLQDLQEQLARGNAGVMAEQGALMTRISQQLAAAGPEMWRDQRNLRAAVTYLLSGGQARAIKAIPDAAALAKDDNALLRGALAYALGRDADALRLLSEVDTRAVTPAIAGHVALIQASLSGTDDLPKVVALLDLARLMSPGTLVEEAALRREIGLVAQMDNFDKFLALSRQYLDRFRNSIYADNFVEVLTGAAVQLAVAPDPARFARLDPLISQLRPEVQCRLLLQIARTATLKAATRVARVASERAEALAQPGTADQARARLYGAAALVATDDYERGVEKLRSVEQAALPAKDAELRDAVSAVAKRLRNWPDAATAGAAAGASPGALAVRAPSAPPLPAAATIDSAERAVATAEALLRGAPQ